MSEQKETRVEVVHKHGNWYIYDIRLNRVIALCTREIDAHLIAGLLNQQHNRNTHDTTRNTV